MNEQSLHPARCGRQRAVTEILCVYRTPDKIVASPAAETPHAILDHATVKKTRHSRKARDARDARQEGCGHWRNETKVRPPRVGNRWPDRRSELHDLARPWAGGHPSLHAAAPTPDHRAIEPTHRHTARGGAALPLHGGKARLCGSRRSARLLAAPWNPGARPCLSVIDSAGDDGATAARSHQRRTARVELDGGPGRR